ncbi:GNAT family N-acetyltransferase [Patiriisocius sp. Uisw_017]|uniref:GNAT family N-acetyltransferase n=1 Tax=Patiriisocius sp. Uisw_017 TaxID=3230968 RepID=UPI0039EC14DA
MSKKTNYSVQRYTTSHFNEWNAFVKTAKNATFLFDRNFMDYHSDRFEDYSLLVFKGDVLFSLLPANVKEERIISHQGLTYGSFILKENAKLLDAFEGFKEVLKFLNTAAVSSLEIRNIPTFYNAVPSDELAYFMFKANGKLLKRDALMVIDTTHKIRFQKNRREGINKAIRNGLKIKLEDTFDSFWNEILIPNLKNKHDVSPVHSLEEITLLAKHFPENIKQVNVYQGDTIVAGTTVFLTKTAIHPQYVSGNGTKNALGSLDLAYDFIINHFEKSKRYFDFNISSEENGTRLNSGLVFWKESCGARTFTTDTYLVQTEAYKTIDLNII